MLPDPEAILLRPELIEAVNGFATDAGMDPTLALKRAQKYLREMAATPRTYMVNLVGHAIRALYRQGYEQITYDPKDVSRIAELGRQHPIVFLPSHRSNMDRPSLQYVLWKNKLPPNHTAGGINMNFLPVGPVIRRTGVFFIRRSFREDRLYKIVLRGYIDHLIESRLPLEWYLEGGRSRSGKLGPPRFGLLNYVVDSLRRGRAPEIYLIPVSIAYDHIQDVPDYAREARGKGKEDESLGWLIRAVRSLRMRYGDIHVRFAEPVAVTSVLEGIEPVEEPSIGLQKLAFEVMNRIGRVTPITPTAVVSIALLATRGRAHTAAQLAESCSSLQDFIRARDLPITEEVDLADPAVVTTVLEGLAEHDNVSSHEAVGRRVFWLDDEQMIRTSYYRNVVVHFFVTRAIAEMALASLVEPAPGVFRDRLLEVRDLLKFEFFFPDKERFLSEVAADVALDVPDWETILAADGASAVLSKMRAPVAHWALLPFLDAYQVFGDELEALDGPLEEGPFLEACLARAMMYRIEDRVISGESASQVLFKSALALARNRRLLADVPGVGEQRALFAAEVRAARRWASLGL